jgi:hypothetical protein
MEAKEPWWASDPTIAAIRRGVLEEIEQARPQLPGPIGPDPVFVDIAHVADTPGPRSAVCSVPRSSRRTAALATSARVGR